MKMIYMQCGLGNQMFQYAFLKYLQKSEHEDIWMDASAPSLHKHTDFELFRIFPAIAASGRLLPYWKGRTLHLWSDLLKKGFGRSLETEGEGEDKTQIPPGKKWLRGYWQEARFAEAVRDELLGDFAFTEPEDEKNRNLLQQIDGCQSVSVHVRAGDYLEPANRVIFGDISTPEYYREAIRAVREKVRAPVFYIFSNDPELAKEYIGDDKGMIYIRHNTGMESYRDMQLMSRCKHHIVANSSFSWWGAWLNPSPEKSVFAPAKWFHNKPGDFTGSILPEDWIRMGSPKPYVTLEAVFSLSDGDIADILRQDYRDFELIGGPANHPDERVKPPGAKPSGIHTISLRPDEMAFFKESTYLGKRVVKMHESPSGRQNE